MAALSSEQRRILQVAADEGAFVATSVPDKNRIVRLHGMGLVQRHPTELERCTITAEGTAALVGDDVSEEAAQVPVVVPAVDASDLVATIVRARALLDEGDLEMARKLSGLAYDQARAAANSAERVKASRELVDKARRMQAEAAAIEAMCYVAMADAVDDAQARGQLARGRPEKVQGEDHFTLEDVGIDKRRLHEARKLRDAVRAEPDFVERVFETRLAEGLEPSRAALKKAAGHAIGTRSATAEEKGYQLYETPIEAIRALLALESFTATVKEPAVGKGAILRPLEDAGYEVVISDLVDRGIATRHGDVQQVGDFLLSQAAGSEGVDIVTNPPYADLANAFAAHALREHKPRKMALLLNFNFAAGFEDPNRAFVMDENPPSRIYLFKRRLPMMHRDGWSGPKASSQMNTAWFVWERNEDGTYGDGYPRLIRIDWERYSLVAEPLAPGACGHVPPMTFAARQEPDEFARDTPRKTLDERIGEARPRALVWIAEQDGFDAVSLRRAIGVRSSVSEALIAEFAERGLIAAREDNQWKITDAGWTALNAAAVVLLVGSEVA